MLKKILKYFGLFLLLAAIFIYIFSPYDETKGFPFKCVIGKIEINAPIDSVFNYMGKSKNAKNWSTFVDHITPLNALDGKVGCKRRCFTSKEETGSTWDEDIIYLEKNKCRRLNIYNLKDFPLSSTNLLTEQTYLKVNEQKTELSLVLYFNPKKKNWSDDLKMYLASFKIKSIFDGNLKNIKREIEKSKRN